MTSHPENPQQHYNNCNCQLCKKQQQIEEWKKQKVNMHLQTMYRNDFIGKKKSKAKKEATMGPREGGHRRQRSMDQGRTISAQYLDLKSTYGLDFVTKKSEISSARPADNLGALSSYMPGSTTYMRSYQSTLVPKPDQPFKVIQMPVANDIHFSSESVYQKAYKREHSSKPNLPFIHRQALSKPKSIGVFESTSKKSYATINPEVSHTKQVINLKPTGNLVNLTSFTHNYDTTYRNFFIGGSKKTDGRHDLDEIGNVYRRKSRAYPF